MKSSDKLFGKILGVLFFYLFASLPLTAQITGWGYEYQGEIPIYIDSLQSQLTYPLAYRNKDVATSNEEWRKEAQAKVWECMGVLPPRPESWDMEVLAEEQRDGYKAQQIEFSLSKWYRVKAYLLIPDGKGKHPAVNVLHDHGAHLTIGKEKVIRPFAVDSAIVRDADEWVAQLYDGQYLGDYLATHGYVVFSTDMPLWGERGRKEGADRKKYDIIAGNMMMAGVNLCAFTHADDVVATDFLASLPFVDKERIGAAGLSIGSYRAWMLAALNDKVKAACCDCWMITTEAQLTRKYGRKENGGFANAIPGLRNWLDYPDIASLVAPRYMLFIAGKKDKLFPVPGVEKAFSIMHDVWKGWGADGKLQTLLLDQGHECNKENQRVMLEFLDKALKK